MATGKGVTLSVDLDDAELQRYLKTMLKRGKDIRPYWKRLGAWMAFRSVDKTFEKRGRPKWEALSDYTLAMRKYHGKSSKKILEVGGDLRRSFTFRATKKRLDVGTNYINSDIHQKGGYVKAPRRWKRDTVEVKKRQLIAIYSEDKKVAVNFAIRYLDKG